MTVENSGQIYHIYLVMIKGSGKYNIIFFICIFMALEPQDTMIFFFFLFATFAILVFSYAVKIF